MRLIVLARSQYKLAGGAYSARNTPVEKDFRNMQASSHLFSRAENPQRAYELRDLARLKRLLR